MEEAIRILLVDDEPDIRRICRILLENSGYTVLEDPAASARRAGAVSESAAAHGAEMIVTACPLCKYNLEKNAGTLPVIYFTELLAEALGIKEDTHEQ